MKLLTVGDSFTYGEELDDLSRAWPVLLSDNLGYTLTNLAVPGGGNTQMIRKVIENFQNYDLIIIAWSHYARQEFADNNGIYDIWPGCNKSFYNTQPHRKYLIDYISKHSSDDYYFHQHIINILMLQNFLDQQKKKYLMLESFSDHHADMLKKSDPLVNLIELSKYIEWPTTMMEWTWGCPQGPGGHFLEEGHQRVADKIYEHIRNLSWIS